MCENCFPMYFFECGYLKIELPCSLKGVDIGMTLLLYEVLIVFCVKDPGEEDAYLGWGIELCCVWGLGSLLNNEGILT